MSTSHEAPLSDAERQSKTARTSAEIKSPGTQVRAGLKKQAEEEIKVPESATTSTATSTGGPDVEMAEASKMEMAARASQEVVAPTAANLGDLKRVWEKHNEYLQSQAVLQQLPQLFPDYKREEAEQFIIWMAQLPVAMHRPRATVTEGWKAAGEILTVQWDEKIPSIFGKMIKNNISCLPVLDQHRRFLGLIDNMSLTIYALKAFGILDINEAAKSLQEITEASAGEQAGEAQQMGAGGEEAAAGRASARGATTGLGMTDAEMAMEATAAAGPEAGAKFVRQLGQPVFVPGGQSEFAGRSIWKSSENPDRDEWGPRWERKAFKEARACDVIAAEVPTLASGPAGSQILISNVSLPAPDVQVLAPPLQQGSSTLYTMELLARTGIHRAPILNSERFLTGLVTQSMIISLVSQYKNKIPSFQAMPVAHLMQFLAPHRLVIVEESCIAAHAFHTFVKERVTGGAVVNSEGVLVDVLSQRDLRGIGNKGMDFQRLWMIVSEFKETVRRDFPDKTPIGVNWVSTQDRMVDVLAKMQDGNLHRVFVCDLANDLPKPIAVITQRDVMRALLVFMGLTLQGEVRVNVA